MDDNDVKIFNWNVRGLNCAARREAVRLLLQQARPQIICLQETKLSEVNFPLAMEFLGAPYCSNFAYLPSEETRGGVLIAWDQDYVARGAVRKENYCISMEVNLLMSNISFVITTVYGPANNVDKPFFLDELVRCQPANTPWLCLGDFNLICEAHDKNNQNINRAQMRRFRQALDSSELLEINLQNRKYTWSNGRRNPTLVRLDRAFCNREWDDIFPDITMQALSISLSDHCPLFLCNIQQPHRRAAFKFENFWTLASFRLFRRLGSCRPGVHPH